MPRVSCDSLCLKMSKKLQDFYTLKFLKIDGTSLYNCILNGLFLTVFLCLKEGRVRCIHSIRPFYVNFVSWFGCLSYNSMHGTVVIGQRGVQDQDVDASSHPSVFAHFTATS